MIIISVVVSSFTAPINVLVDVLFEDILMAPTPSCEAENDGKVQRQSAKVPSIMKRIATELDVEANSSRRALVASIRSTLYGPRSQRRMEIPEETTSAHGRASLLDARSLSRLSSHQSLAYESGLEMNTNAGRLVSKLVSDIKKQRQTISYDQLFAFDAAWR